MPGLQKLSFAGKNFEDSGRTLEQCASNAALRSPLCSRAATQVWREVLARQVPALAHQHQAPLSAGARRKANTVRKPAVVAASDAPSISGDV
jgi:hypothetical protein